MRSKTLLTGLLLVAVFATLIIVGCNEGNSKPVAKELIFPASSLMEEIPSTDKQIKKILRLMDSSRKVLGYTVEMQVTSRSGPFDILIALDSNARVLNAEVLKYRAIHGKRVCSETFTRQFTGKSSGDAVVLGNDIDAISKATLSSKAMTDGVRKAIALVSKSI